MSNSAFTPTFAQNLQDASATQSGLVNTSAQTIAGNKTFSGTTTLTGAFVPSSPQMFRNKIINPGFTIWQRGTSFVNPANFSYTADRWYTNFDGSATTRTILQNPLNVMLPDSNFLSPFYLRYQQTSAAGGTVNILATKIEDVRTLSGQTVTLTFWANTNISSLSVTPEISQLFDNGGAGNTNTTASAVSVTPIGGAVTGKYSVTMTLPTAAGKTIGSGSSLEVKFKLPTTGTWVFDVFHVQLEIGSASTPPEERPVALELALCQRYFEILLRPGVDGGIPVTYFSTTGAEVHIPFKVSKRGALTLVAPASGFGRVVQWNDAFALAIQSCSAVFLSGNTAESASLAFTTAFAAGYYHNSYDLVGGGGNIAVSAELP